MKFTYSWLLEHLDTKATSKEVEQKLTSLGLEVESCVDMGAKYAPFLVAEIVEAEKHPNADKLRVCKVNTGTEVLQIVCGAPNARAGIKVCLAPVGALIPNGNFAIKKSKIRDVESNGMLCSTTELELGTDGEGIMELPLDAKVGSKFADLKGLNDILFEIAITPNRADCLSVRGVARDLAAGGLGVLKPLEIKSAISNQKSKISVTSESYYIGRYFAGVKNGPSPDWLASRLKSIGLAPISALVDITNYFTFNFGRPLHVYDADKIKGNLQITNCKKSKFNALNNKSYELENDLVVADDNGPVALAGVIGNIESSVDENTKNVFLEVAYFDPAAVAANGRKHQIDSDARYRFERGIDAGFMEDAAALATKLIVEVCGGTPSELVIAGQKPSAARVVPFDANFINEYTGLSIAESKAKEILQSLGFIINGSKATVPTWRNDVNGREDLAEEVVRVIGLDNVPLQPLPYAAPVKTNAKNIKQVLAASGLTEVVTYSFMPENTAKLFGEVKAEYKLLNPISADLAVLRPSILPNLIEAAKGAFNRGFKNVALFEVGPSWNDKEQNVVAGIRTGKTNERNVFGDARDFDVFDAKADLLAITGNIGEVRESAPSYYHPGRSGGLYLGKNCIGYFGELHPALVKTLDVGQRLVAFEVFLDNLPNQQRKFKKIELSDFQAVNRDFAFVMPKEARAEQVLAAIRKTNQLIEKAEVFDVYEGDKMEAGKKSVAISVTLQPKDKTLTDAEIEAVCTKVVAEVEGKFAANLRK